VPAVTRRDASGSDEELLALSGGVRPLDESARTQLERIGRRWRRSHRARPALPVDPALHRYPERATRTGRNRFAPITLFAADSGATLFATERAAEPLTPLTRLAGRARRVILGHPRASSALAHERMRKLVALPVLASDLLSSVAYAPEAMLAVLVVGGALAWSVPLGLCLSALMLLVGVSYRQTIRAYPTAGGSYVVASDNLGIVAGLVAGAGLLVDYVMTVAVSVAAGVQAVASAVPALRTQAVPLGVGVIAVLLIGNLRGVREAGTLFAGPTYAFLAAMVLLLGAGLWHVERHGTASAPVAVPGAAGVGVLLLLRAFASGAAAMTGIEAVSNAIPVFERPQWRNARTTLTWMVALLVGMFLGILLLARLEGIVPHPEQSLLSELATYNLGSGVLYGYVQVATASVLLLAANTAFNGLPRLLYLMARDSCAPRAFLHVGDRLAFSNGIVALASASAVLLVAFHGRTLSLIPLYAVGVFLAFTLSQAGMTVRWLRSAAREPHRRLSLAVNATGAAVCALVTLIAVVSKFVEGAWVVTVVVPLLVLGCRQVRRHYAAADAAVALSTTSGVDGDVTPASQHHLVVVCVGSLDQATLRGLAYARSLGRPVLAVHLSPDRSEAKEFSTAWQRFGDPMKLEVLISPYRAVVAPLAHYLAAVHAQAPDLTLTVVVPQTVARHAWQRWLLHSRVGGHLRRALVDQPRTLVVEAPFHLPD